MAWWLRYPVQSAQQVTLELQIVTIFANSESLEASYSTPLLRRIALARELFRSNLWIPGVQNPHFGPSQESQDYLHSSAPCSKSDRIRLCNPPLCSSSSPDVLLGFPLELKLPNNASFFSDFLTFRRRVQSFSNFWTYLQFEALSLSELSIVAQEILSARVGGTQSLKLKSPINPYAS
jgi:hypothetical protein